MKRHASHRYSFSRTVLRNEFRALRGRQYVTIVYLAAILLIAFLTFGFALGTLRYQHRLAADPFANWVNLTFHSGTRDSLQAVREAIASTDFRRRYNIRGAYFYNKGTVTVLTGAGKGTAVPCEARTIDPSSSVTAELFGHDSASVCYGGSPDSAFLREPNGVIISERLRRDLGISREKLSYIRMRSVQGDFVPVPLLGVASRLPDRTDMVYTGLFYCKSLNEGFYDRGNPWFRILVEDFDTAALLTALGEICTALQIADPAAVQTTRAESPNKTALTWKIEVPPALCRFPQEVMEATIAALPSLLSHRAGRWYEISKDTACDDRSFYHDYLAIEFGRLDRIRDFAACLEQRFGLELDLEVLAGRERYLLANNLAAGGLLLVLLITAGAVSVYLASVLRHHLARMKKNLGSFLAFGVRNRTLIKLYIGVALMLLGAALVPAFLTALAAGTLMQSLLAITTGAPDPGEAWFILLSGWSPALAAGILLVAAVRTSLTVRAILKRSPGDLLYERDH